ncbi:metallophosphoesterase family protein [Rubricoccus marinus]|uniref:Metallophosphoesterase n=1 Tax=Rubricoccus marinus TaxID=716817 RepID=A0A259U2N2_9BACT|nr:metallophosphoesterase family protein [Rubricoccus marinus]OZC04196.1 metallophosphoesterase [Rubricoccus marinus]
MALYAIGDIHGCLGTLDALLDRLALTPEDHVVFIGDYIDRGPDSYGVIERMMALRDAAASGDGPACTFIRGNHDQMLLDWADAKPGAYDLWSANGGLETLMSYPDTRVPPEHFAFYRATVLAAEIDGFAFVHAGFLPGESIEEQLEEPNPDVVLWTRKHLNADLSAWDIPVVCGHTPVSQPLSEEMLIAIDTGAVYAHRPDLGKLTAVRLPEREFISVPYQR